MSQLSNPDSMVADNLESEVDFDNRIQGIKMHGLKGNSQVGLYSLEEVLQFMAMDPIEDLQQYGSKGSIHYVDLASLSTWIRTVHGDDELAAAVDDVVESHDNYRDRVGPVRELLEERLEQIDKR